MAAAHAQLIEFLRNAEAWHVLFDQEGSNPARPEIGLALGVHHQRVGIWPVGDPHLAAIEQVVATLVFGLELHAEHVAAGARLAHGQCADVLTADEPGQVLLALLGRAVSLNLVHTQVAVGTIAQANRGAGARDFFHGNHVRQVTHVGAAVFFAHCDAQQAQRAHFAPQVHGELVASVNLGSAGGDLGLGKIPHRVAQGVDLLAKLKIKSGQGHGSSPIKLN